MRYRYAKAVPPGADLKKPLILLTKTRVAERGGFEPPIPFGYSRFPGVRIKPLCHLSFDATFFVALGRVTVLALISPMRTERDHPVGFDALPAAQNLLHQRTHVVI